MGLMLLTLRKKQLLPRRPGLLSRAAILREQTSGCSKAPQANPNTPETTQEGRKPQQRGPESPGGGTKQIRVLGGGGAATGHSFYPPLLPTSSSTGKESRSSPSEASGCWAGAAPAGPLLPPHVLGGLVHCSGKAALRAETWRAETQRPQEGALFLIKNKGRRQPGKAGCHLPCSAAWGKVSLLLSPVADGPADAPRCAELGAARARLCCLGLGDTRCARAATSPSPAPRNDTLLTEVLGRGCNASPAKDRAGLSQTGPCMSPSHRSNTGTLPQQGPRRGKPIPIKALPAAGSCKGPAGWSLVLPAANWKMRPCSQTRAEQCFPFPCSFEAKLWVMAEDCSTPGKSCSIAALPGQCG